MFHKSAYGPVWTGRAKTEARLGMTSEAPDVRRALGAFSCHKSWHNPCAAPKLLTQTPRMHRYTVLVADDHVIVREGLVSLLKAHDFDVVAEVGDGRSLIDEARRLRPDLILTDMSMPGLTGLEALEHLKSAHVDAKVIILTMHSDADLATQALRAGASGFLLKHSAGAELLAAIDQSLQDHVYLTSTLMKEVFERMAVPAEHVGPLLTVRQREVLRLILKGRRMKEIANDLQLSARTVETHKYQMMQALGVDSTAELVKYAIEHRLTVD